MTPYLLAATAITSAAAAWTVQGWRYEGRIAELQRTHAEAAAQHQADYIKQLEEAREQIEKYQQRAQQAQDSATMRVAGADAALRRNRTELERLRDAISNRPDAVCLPNTSADATTPPADPAGDILGECAAALTDMARAADGHASDVRMMIDASVKP